MNVAKILYRKRIFYPVVLANAVNNAPHLLDSTGSGLIASKYFTLLVSNEKNIQSEFSVVFPILSSWLKKCRVSPGQ